MKKLNFGSGSIKPTEWDNVDIENLGQKYIGTSDIFIDNTYDIIVAHCVLQMIPYHDLVVQLADLRRILKSGGVLRISLPDIIRGFEAYQKNDIEWFPNSEEKIDDLFSAWLTWYSTSKTLLTPISLINKLRKAGFKTPLEVNFKQSLWIDPDGQLSHEHTELDTREGECYFIEAIK